MGTKREVKLNIDLTYDPGISFLGVYPKDMST